MPELPEVETVARDLARLVAGQRVVSARVLRERNIATPDAPTFISAIAGRAIRGVRRRAKWIIVDLEGEVALLVHLRMTGQLLVLPASAPLDPYVRAALLLDDGRELRFRDVRAFGRLALVACDDDGIPASSLDPSDAPLLADHGPEPLEPSFTADVLGALLARRPGRLKGTLLDQRCIAGLGNIYADEALWRAHLHPLAAGAALRRDEVERLHAAIVGVLSEAVEARGSSIDDYTGPDGDGTMQERLAVYQRQGEPCLVCGATIRRFVVGGRATHICPTCQPLPRGGRRAGGELPRGAASGDRSDTRRGGRWSERVHHATVGAAVAERAAARRRAVRSGGEDPVGVRR
jgi:formamidopyrimidine-DNA glycosylase